MRILIIKTSSMGDIIHCLPIIADIRMHFPNAVIDWVVEEGFVDILRLHPHINSIIAVAIRRWRKHLFNRKTWHEIAGFKKLLSLHTYEVILDTQSLVKSAMLTTLAKGKRHGQNFNSAREAVAAIFYNQRHFVPRNQHAVAMYRQLAAHALGYALPHTLPDYGLPTAHIASIMSSAFSESIKLPVHYVMALHATSRDSKLWPVAYWVALGNALNQQSLSLVLPWASESELARAEAISCHVPSAVVLPKLNLAQLAPVIAGAKAAIGVDTGLVHLAVALKIPTIAIYTDTYPKLNGAYAGLGSIAINLGQKGVITTSSEVLAAFLTFNINGQV